ncbi:hypothetical protein FOMPIDRAFT_1023410 [Fomitopsis schrenkii]|uniref:Uncharacterized protein n=1 Tax=Fomitopsis schrenkii TaxID=2126942 RepID=S8E8S3_FOMSC|nr:hypothetical protein FOMPIDRAFT_1023410 [Fomitopsis schrenkii]
MRGARALPVCMKPPLLVHAGQCLAQICGKLCVIALSQCPEPRFLLRNNLETTLSAAEVHVPSKWLMANDQSSARDSSVMRGARHSFPRSQSPKVLACSSSGPGVEYFSGCSSQIDTTTLHTPSR